MKYENNKGLWQAFFTFCVLILSGCGASSEKAQEQASSSTTTTTAVQSDSEADSAITSVEVGEQDSSTVESGSIVLQPPEAVCDVAVRMQPNGRVTITNGDAVGTGYHILSEEEVATLAGRNDGDRVFNSEIVEFLRSDELDPVQAEPDGIDYWDIWKAELIGGRLFIMAEGCDEFVAVYLDLFDPYGDEIDLDSWDFEAHAYKEEITIQLAQLAVTTTTVAVEARDEVATESTAPAEITTTVAEALVTTTVAPATTTAAPTTTASPAPSCVMSFHLTDRWEGKPQVVATAAGFPNTGLQWPVWRWRSPGDSRPVAGDSTTVPDGWTSNSYRWTITEGLLGGTYTFKAIHDGQSCQGSVRAPDSLDGVPKVVG